jgi:GH24 family phage-related lysozyme (muramidase)
MASKKVLAHIKDREGVIYESYLDSLKKPTAGVGHLLTKDEQKLYPTGTKIPKAQVDKWLKEDLAKAETAAKTQADQMRAKGLAVDPNFEESLISVNFQLGTGWTTKFPTAWKNLQSGNYEGAVEEIKFTSEGSGTESDWAKQTPTRVNDFTQAIRNQADYKPGKQSNLSNYEKAQNMVAGGDDNIIAGLMPQEEVVTETQEVVEQRPTGFKQLEQQMFNPMQSNYANQNLPNAPRNLGTVELPPDQTITPYRETIKEDVTVRPDQIRVNEDVQLTSIPNDARQYSIGEQQERARRSMMQGNRQDRMEDYQVNREYQEDYPYLYPRNTGSYALPQQQAAQRMMGGYAEGGTVDEAQGLASLGRGGDSTLVHMQPREVAGLQQLAQANGTSLTRNPMTGYPEAFQMGGLLKGAATLAAGYFTGGAGFGLGAQIAAGAATGAGLAAATGDDPIMGAVSGGLGGMSGGGLNTAMMGPSTATGMAGTSSIANPLAGATPIQGAATGTAMPGYSFGQTQTPTVGTSGLETGGGALADGTIPQTDVVKQIPSGGSNNLNIPRQGAVDFSGSFNQGIDQVYRNLGTVDPTTGLIKDASTMEVAKTLGSPIASMGLGGLEESDFMVKPDFNDPRDVYNPRSTLDLSRDTGVSEAMSRDTGLRLLARGGYLGGGNVGDGMSDDIPATIEGDEPAALSQGEFVIPADVVSHLGNGSSEAGSKQLHAMMARIRQARTGRKSQGKEIKPGKYMPR